MTKLFRKCSRTSPCILSNVLWTTVQHASIFLNSILFIKLPVVQTINKKANQMFVQQFCKHFLSQKNREGFICKTPYRAEKACIFHAFLRLRKRIRARVFIKAIKYYSIVTEQQLNTKKA